MAKLRVCVIGLGYFSQLHLEAWKNIEGVTLVGACDTAQDRRENTQKNFDTPCYESVSDMLDNCNPDIVDIVTPPPAHAELIRTCLKPNRLVICQKPFCIDLDEAEKITREAETAGTTLIIHENFRFQPWYRATKSFLRAGKMGQIYSARFALRPGDGRGPDAYMNRQPAFQTMPRLLIHETGVHFIDLFRWLIGPVEAVYADLRRLNPVLKGEDAGMFVLDHASGARSVFDGNRLSDHVTDTPRLTMGELEIEGEGGTLRLDGFGTLEFRRFGTQEWQTIEIESHVDRDSFGGGCVEALCRHAATALQSGAAFENIATDYLSVLKIESAAYLSAENGCKTRVTL